MRRELVALGREMAGALGVEPALIVPREQRGDDDRRRDRRRFGGQIST
jgi:hypothetical protein